MVKASARSLEKVDKSKTLGELGEQWAQEEYWRRGYTIIAKNEYHRKGKRLGEIDFIAKNRDSLAFVEVKTRTAGAGTYGKGVDSVNQFKQQRLLKAVKLYLLKHQELESLRPHIDVCSIEVENIDKKQFSAIILENVVEDWS